MLSFRGVKQLWLLAERGVKHSPLPDNRLIINGSCHRPLSILSRVKGAFVTATALKCILLMNYKILGPGTFDPVIFFYQTAANLNTAVVQCHPWQTEKSISVYIEREREREERAGESSVCCYELFLSAPQQMVVQHRRGASLRTGWKWCRRRAVWKWTLQILRYEP